MKDFVRQYIVLFLITMLSAVGFCALSYLNVLQLSVQSEEQYIVTCNMGVIDEIETSLLFGKQLSNYYGISQLLRKGKRMFPEDTILVLTDATGNAIATTEDAEIFRISLRNYGAVEQQIYDEQGVAGALTTYYAKKWVRDDLAPAMRRSVFGSVGLFAFLLVICAGIHSRKKLSVGGATVLLIAAILVQGAFLIVNYADAFQNIAEKSVHSVASYVSTSIENVLDKGVRIEEMMGLEDFLARVEKENAFIDAITLRKNVRNADSDYTVNLQNSGDGWSLSSAISGTSIRTQMIQMILMFAATSFLAVIVMKESLILSDILAFRKTKEHNTASERQYEILSKEIRYGNFLALTFDYMCLSFSALQIKAWNQGFLSMPPVMAAALSISMCQIADVLGMIAMPSIGKRVRGQHLMAVSAFLIAAANVSCFLTHRTAVIILMRFFAGLGTAGTKQVRNMVIAEGSTNDAQLNRNLAASNNGIIGGLLCGMGFGGVIAAGFDYQMTFFVAGIGYLLYFLFEAYCFPWKLLAEQSTRTMAEQEDGNLILRMFSAFRSMSVWRTMLLIVMPQYFMLMIIVCLIPGRIQRLALPGVVLTYANLLNGVIGLYVGERLYRVLQRVIRNNLRIQMLMLVLGASVLFMMDLPLAPVAVILLSASLAGLLDGIGTPIATDIFMGNGYLLLHFNDTEILMLYSLIGTAVMAVSPFLLELCEKSVFWMYAVGLLFLGSALLLLPDSMKRKKKRS